MAWKSKQQQIFEDECEMEEEADNTNNPYRLEADKKEKFVCFYGHVWEEDVESLQKDLEELDISAELHDIITGADLECPVCGTVSFIPVKVLSSRLDIKTLQQRFDEVDC